MFKLSLLPREYFDISFKQMIKFVPCVATYETLWKTPTTLCKSTWRVYGLLIVLSASGFPVIKFQPATCNLQNIPAALSSAEVQAFVISIRCARCTAWIDQAENLC